MNSSPCPSTPKHIAIIMDGNGRWAQRRMLPRTMGHLRGASRIKSLVRAASERGVTHITLFAFSTENWGRPQEEVSFLMDLFVSYCEREVRGMRQHGVKLKVIGDLQGLPQLLQDRIRWAEEATQGNRTIQLTVAINYGGRWDIAQALRAWQKAHPLLDGNDISEDSLSPFLSTAGMPEPDLLIRTGGESRISNFLLWQMAYAELYFVDTLWPEFDESALDEAIEWFSQRTRRFGKIAAVAEPG